MLGLWNYATPKGSPRSIAGRCVKWSFTTILETGGSFSPNRRVPMDGRKPLAERLRGARCLVVVTARRRGGSWSETLASADPRDADGITERNTGERRSARRRGVAADGLPVQSPGRSGTRLAMLPCCETSCGPRKREKLLKLGEPSSTDFAEQSNRFLRPIPVDFEHLSHEGERGSGRKGPRETQ